MLYLESKKLRKIFENHKKWIATGGKEGERAELCFADLHGADLHGADLRFADLRFADLHGADLHGADLCCANLHGANLRCANLHGADLHGADLRFANLRGADLHGADLHGADLHGAELHGANLRGTNLRGTNLDYSEYQLRCGNLDVHIDDRLAAQILYHLVRNVLFSKNTSEDLKQLLSNPSIVKAANRFHRVKECGEIELKEG